VAGVVDPQADRPVYKQIADQLRAAIATGVLGPGEQVPSEHDLVAEYGVARGTARQAIMLLRNEGLIPGAFVSSGVSERDDRAADGDNRGADGPQGTHLPVTGDVRSRPSRLITALSPSFSRRVFRRSLHRCCRPQAGMRRSPRGHRHRSQSQRRTAQRCRPGRRRGKAPVSARRQLPVPSPLELAQRLACCGYPR
jgi:DNA-binding transcriptional MocR family regulator